MLGYDSVNQGEKVVGPMTKTTSIDFGKQNVRHTL